MPIRPRRLRPLTALAAVLALVPLTAVAGAPASADPSPSPSGSDAAAPTTSAKPLRWRACPKDVPTMAGLRCSTVEVPLDYSRPDGRTIEVAISRLRATSPGKRRGILLTNSGGPGGTGLGFVTTLAEGGTLNTPLPASVRQRYDIIGVDPRGVGHSTPVTCDLPDAFGSTFAPYAGSRADVLEHAALSRKVARGCGTSSTKRLLPHITTANTARDLDRVRAALGEEKASYLGVSYGTYLGAVWATMFPATGDRILIDSAVSPGGWDTRFQRSVAGGFEDRFPDLAAYAAATPELGLGTTPAEVRASFDRIVARLDAEPRADGITSEVFRQATFASLYYDEKLPEIAALWTVLDQGVTIPTDGAANPLEDTENYRASQLHVICNDTAWPESTRTYVRHARADRERFPMFGGATGSISPCAFWPSEPREPKVRIRDRGPSNVLQVQNLRDPATSLAAARRMRAALGDRARFVTADQGGHLAYLFGDNQCLNGIVTRFLVTGERPARDGGCDAETP